MAGRHSFKYEAFDILNGWDLAREKDQEQLSRRIVEEKPDAIFYYRPICAHFSHAQHESWAHSRRSETPSVEQVDEDKFKIEIR